MKVPVGASAEIAVEPEREALTRPRCTLGAFWRCAPKDSRKVLSSDVGQRGEADGRSGLRTCQRPARQMDSRRTTRPTVVRSAVISNANSDCGKTKAFMNQSFGRRTGQVLSGLQHLQHLVCIILHIHDLWGPLKVNGSCSLLCGAAFIWADQCDMKYQS